MQTSKFSTTGSIACLLAFSCLSSLSQNAIAYQLSVSSSNPKQGETVEVIVQDAPAVAEQTNSQNTQTGKTPPVVHFNNADLPTFTGDGGNNFRTLLSVPADLKPGEYHVTVDGDSKTLTVKAGLFPVQKLTLPKSKDNFEASPGEIEAVNKAKETLSQTRSWNKSFTVPSKARISSVFGMRRIVNGKLLDDYFHSGIDYAGHMGSPVYATAPGTVILATRGYKLHGNIIAIDHGQGVVSFYLHLQQFTVKLGEKVKAGQEIGKVGQTGRASGPHLHFSIYVNKVAANPTYWYSKVY